MSLQLMRVVADVGGLYQPVRLERTLNTQIPLLSIRDTRVGIRAAKPRISGEGKGVSRDTLAWKCCPGTAAEGILGVIDRNGAGIQERCRAIQERRDHVLGYVPIQIDRKIVDPIAA